MLRSAAAELRKEIHMNVQISHRLHASAPAAARALVRIVIVGEVDHGKSTLIGRLLHEAGGLPDGKLDALKAMSARRGMPFEWSFLLDALQTERDQGITIDTSQIRLRAATRDIVLIDAPGHAEFLRNMITGAAQADAAVLIVDATEGVRNQTRRHGYLLHLLGVRQVMVVINKMDRVAFDAGKHRPPGRAGSDSSRRDSDLRAQRRRRRAAHIVARLVSRAGGSRRARRLRAGAPAA